eukprot:GFYU01011252.1.p1 GENE.GFYU01011252.1~~GFYU01011252.1.p1  ORF type:complete len:322 (-),score=59.32 GFYU01011252.1:62-1027(-)
MSTSNETPLVPGRQTKSKLIPIFVGAAFVIACTALVAVGYIATQPSTPHVADNVNEGAQLDAYCDNCLQWDPNCQMDYCHQCPHCQPPPLDQYCTNCEQWDPNCTLDYCLHCGHCQEPEPKEFGCVGDSISCGVGATCGDPMAGVCSGSGPQFSYWQSNVDCVTDLSYCSYLNGGGQSYCYPGSTAKFITSPGQDMLINAEAGAHKNYVVYLGTNHVQGGCQDEVNALKHIVNTLAQLHSTEHVFVVRDLNRNYASTLTCHINYLLEPYLLWMSHKIHILDVSFAQEVTYCSDNVHPTSSGYQEMANIIQSKINAVLAGGR